MTTDPNLAERAYQAGRAGGPKPEVAGEVERRVVDGFYRAGLRQAGRPVPEQQDADASHDPGG